MTGSEVWLTRRKFYKCKAIKSCKCTVVVERIRALVEVTLEVQLLRTTILVLRHTIPTHGICGVRRNSGVGSG